MQTQPKLAPGIKSTVYPDKKLSFNEFHLYIRKQLSKKTNAKRN